MVVTTLSRNWLIHVFDQFNGVSAHDVVSFELVKPHRAVEVLSQFKGGTDAHWTAPFIPAFLNFKVGFALFGQDFIDCLLKLVVLMREGLPELFIIGVKLVHLRFSLSDL